MKLDLATPTIDPGNFDVTRAAALYVHVPFCFHKCHYCDFYSIVGQTPARMTAFVNRVLTEADLWCKARGVFRPRTIFFGGGTPSLLPADDMRRLITGLRERFDFSAVDEFTIEVNPATASLPYFDMLRSLGVTRLSFGAQSFDRAELAMLERHHEPADVHRSVQIARAAGFSRINVDLIFGVPGQSMESWMKSLDEAMRLQTPHISCYALTYEPNTPLAVKKRLGVIRPIEESLELDMLRRTRSHLSAAGYEAYEISNFARSGEACRHNLIYWDGGNYLSLGPSASSHMDGTRWKNDPHLGRWESAVDAYRLPAVDAEQLSATQRMGEYAMLRLRLREGIELAKFAHRWNACATQVFADVIDRYYRASLLAIDAESIRLTEAGVAVADAIAAEFISAVR